MREQRWESTQIFSLEESLDTLKRLNAKGLKTTPTDRETICYIEEWEVNSPEEVRQIDAWLVEDITRIQVFDEWVGDFFLFAGHFHTVFQQYESIDTYCSISHPWTISGHLATLYPEARFLARLSSSPFIHSSSPSYQPSHRPRRNLGRSSTPYLAGGA